MGLKKKRKAVGGVFFITCAFIGMLLIIAVTDLSKSTTITAVSDNISHVVATKVAIFSYNNNTPSYDTQTGLIKSGSKSYSPLKDFNEMASYYGFLKKGATESTVKWDKRKRVAYVDIGVFECDCRKSNLLYKDNRAGKMNQIKPHEQTTKIEDK